MNNTLALNSAFIHPNPEMFDSPKRQYFSLPFGIISYITQNPVTADGLLKLQKTCKYFFAKNKIIIFDTMLYHNNNISFYRNCIDKFIELNAEKYWLIDQLYITSLPNPSTKFYCCTLRQLTFYETKISLNEFNFLLNGGKVTYLRMYLASVYDGNENLVSCDKILSKVPNIKSFSFNCENYIFTNEIFKNMNSVIFNTKINYFELYFSNLCDGTDITILCDFIFKNMYQKHSSFTLCFHNLKNYKLKMKSVLANKIQENGDKFKNVRIYVK